MLSVSAVKEPMWATQLDIPSQEELTLKFSDLMSSKARAKGPERSKTVDQDADEELQKELAFLSEQWRQQEVSSRIA